MALSTQIPMVGYFIYRSGEQADPTALEFCPPKGSDELFFALKTAYPHVKTHSDRMRNAVIEFLKQELNEEQSQMTTPIVPMEADLSYDIPTESPWWPSMDSTASTLSSPDLFNLATPASMSSSQAPTMSRQNSSSQPSSIQKAKPGLEEMTGVFSLSSTSQPKTRVRRKMTESEKLEYRKRRIVKACDSCSKRKRKCSHNQPEMEKVRSSKVTKSKAPASNISSACVEQIEKAVFQPAEPSIVDEDPFVFLNQNMFSDLPAIDDFFFDAAATTQVPQQTTWPWSDTADWTLIDTPLLAQASPSSPSYQQALFPASTGLLSPQPTPQIELIHEPAEQIRVSDLPTTTQTPTRTWRTFSDFSRTAFSTADGLDGKEQSTSMGLSTPGDMMSPSQLRNLYSPLATLTGPQSSLSLGSSAIEKSTMSSGSSEMAPQLVPQAHGLVENACRPEAPQLRGTDGGIASIGLTSGLIQVTSQQTHNGQTGAGLRHVVTENNATSPTRSSGDQHIGNSCSISGTAAIAESGLQKTARTLPPARSNAGLAPISPNATGQLSAPIAETSSHGLSSTMSQSPTASESMSRERTAATGETPSVARPSSLSADSTSTSSSTSITRTTPASLQPRSQAASADLHGGFPAAGTPSTLNPATAHHEDPEKLTLVTQTKARHEGGDESSPTQGEQIRRLPLKSGLPAAPQAAATPLQPLRHRLKRSPGQVIAPATSAGLDLDDTRIAAAVLVAQVCMAWRAVASAFVQAVSTRTSCGVDNRDCPSLSVPQAVLLTA
ncbi:hypothetical protein E4T49_08033 [Aureobasidium sp. EXF-10728]|nr:hypothetical protein E4T49_08033 [Aureobasidium sp. EXF-10728]